MSSKFSKTRIDLTSTYQAGRKAQRCEGRGCHGRTPFELVPQGSKSTPPVFCIKILKENFEDEGLREKTLMGICFQGS